MVFFGNPQGDAALHVDTLARSLLASACANEHNVGLRTVVQACMMMMPAESDAGDTHADDASDANLFITPSKRHAPSRSSTMEDSNATTRSTKKNKLTLDEQLDAKSNTLTIGGKVVATYGLNALMFGSVGGAPEARPADSGDDSEEEEAPAHFFRISVRERWVQRVRGMYEHELPWPTQLGEKLRIEIVTRRGRRQKSVWRGSESTFEVEIDGRTYLVANVLPVCVLATRANLQAFY